MQTVFAQGVRDDFGPEFKLEVEKKSQGGVSISYMPRWFKRGMEVEFLAVGFVSAPPNAELARLRGYLLPVAHGFLGAGSWWHRDSDRLEHVIGCFSAHIVGMSETSGGLGGIRSVDLAGPDWIEVHRDAKSLLEPQDLDERRKIGKDFRERRQDFRFQLALAHYHSLNSPEVASEGMARGLGPLEIFELEVANLYTLARALKVKEIIPRIIKAFTPEIQTYLNRQPTPRELTQLIAKLNRRNDIP